ncbi:MAG: glucokinase [Alkalimonas sp.]|nr:glucokinase [Alkalimonas sp.]
MADAKYAIVADIGGTNARFSRVNLQDLSLDKVQVFACADFASLADALQHYREQQQLSLGDVAIAIACPVQGDEVRMTNFHWQFSIQAMKQQLRLSTLLVMNDFTAVAMCLPVVQQGQSVQIGQGQPKQGHPMAVLGAGTGLGVGHLLPLTGGLYLPLPGEGGHTDWAPVTAQEWAIHQFLAAKYGHVSPERLLSGPGLEDLYLAIADYQQRAVEPLSAAAITAAAEQGDDAVAVATLEQFFASLGSLAGDLALTLSTAGGVFIGGGIVPRLLPLLERSAFRSRFEQKGRFQAFNQAIPTYVITAEQPGLTGAALYLKQTMTQQTQSD